MHSAALAEMGLGQWSYEAIEVSPEGFEELVRSLPEQGFAGVNVTVPHKLSALAIADEATDAARGIGAANTLTFAGGRIQAENTDASAILAALPRPPEGMRALVMGAGGSARAAVWALQRAGADVNVWNRTPERAEALARELGVGLDTKAPQILVNATTVGLAGANRASAGCRTRAARSQAISALGRWSEGKGGDGVGLRISRHRSNRGCSGGRRNRGRRPRDPRQAGCGIA